jgi:hypothetical protein
MACIGATLLVESGKRRQFHAGSFIVPMDTTYQDDGCCARSGWYMSALRNGVPVHWAIKSAKRFAVDFVASTVTQSSATINAWLSWRPLRDLRADAGKGARLSRRGSRQPPVKVHARRGIRRGRCSAPHCGTANGHAQGRNEDIAVGYLNAAAFRLNRQAAATSPDLLTPAQIAGPTTTNHHDGALFDAGTPNYCQFMSMHWG